MSRIESELKKIFQVQRKLILKSVISFSNHIETKLNFSKKKSRERVVVIFKFMLRRLFSQFFSKGTS